MRRTVAFAALIMASLFVAAQAPPAADNKGPAQPAVVRPGENLVVENIPPIPLAIAEKANQYGEFRSATLLDWNPVKREMLVSTRFADVPQIHMLKMPGGARTQLTFFPDRTGGAHYGPKGDYFVFSKDVGGGEWFQLYRYDLANGNVTLLTDGKSRNTGPVYSHNSNLVAYSSTRRTGQDTDIWMMDPTNPKSDHLLMQLQGGGWEALDFSPDNKKLLVLKEVSANQSSIFLVDAQSGEKTLITPDSDKAEIHYNQARFSHRSRFGVPSAGLS
jgi:Tol biopolymer transport system component